MKLTVGRNCIEIHLESDLEKAFIEDTLGLTDSNDSYLIMSRVTNDEAVTLYAYPDSSKVVIVETIDKKIKRMKDSYEKRIEKMERGAKSLYGEVKRADERTAEEIQKRIWCEEEVRGETMCHKIKKLFLT